MAVERRAEERIRERKRTGKKVERDGRCKNGVNKGYPCVFGSGVIRCRSCKPIPEIKVHGVHQAGVVQSPRGHASATRRLQLQVHNTDTYVSSRNTK